MRKYVRGIGFAAICGAAMLSSGCMGLSLFSSPHTHYHGGAELEKRIDQLEMRMDAVEKAQAPPITNVPPRRFSGKA